MDRAHELEAERPHEGAREEQPRHGRQVQAREDDRDEDPEGCDDGDLVEEGDVVHVCSPA